MDAINKYLVAEVDAAYNLVEMEHEDTLAWKEMYYDLRDKFHLAIFQRNELRTNVEHLEATLQNGMRQYREQSQTLSHKRRYSEWLEGRVVLPTGGTVPPHLLQHVFYHKIRRIAFVYRNKEYVMTDCGRKFNEIINID